MSIDFGRFLPNFWLQNYPTNDHWDRILNDLLDMHDLKRVGSCTVKIGPIVVWIANYPYAFGSPRVPMQLCLPRVRTRRRLKKLVNRMLAKEVEDKIHSIDQMVKK